MKWLKTVALVTALSVAGAGLAACSSKEAATKDTEKWTGKITI